MARVSELLLQRKSSVYLLVFPGMQNAEQYCSRPGQVDTSTERALKIAGVEAPGRPHVAEALVEGGDVANFRQAFVRYLHDDGTAYCLEQRACLPLVLSIFHLNKPSSLLLALTAIRFIVGSLLT
ncbi:Hypothetical protein PHPALM_38025 [Phytophthora palmivora]|uniref:Uncharacterized protein n=1 Tax=Phytophthora palmivora TaxID=4796 RepID=A0A2P4WVY6_9STRA|nr:Hypothetical protein PHPALM_38025 [Phytophthora palmivora]